MNEFSFAYLPSIQSGAGTSVSILSHQVLPLACLRLLLKPTLTAYLFYSFAFSEIKIRSK